MFSKKKSFKEIALRFHIKFLKRLKFLMSFFGGFLSLKINRFFPQNYVFEKNK